MTFTLGFQGGTQSLWTGGMSVGWPEPLPGLSGLWLPWDSCLGILGGSCPTGSSRDGAFDTKVGGWGSCFHFRAAERGRQEEWHSQIHTQHKCPNTAATAHPGDPLFALPSTGRRGYAMSDPQVCSKKIAGLGFEPTSDSDSKS